MTPQSGLQIAYHLPVTELLALSNHAFYPWRKDNSAFEFYRLFEEALIRKKSGAMSKKLT
jgi:hypothetical protein